MEFVQPIRSVALRVAAQLNVINSNNLPLPILFVARGGNGQKKKSLLVNGNNADHYKRGDFLSTCRKYQTGSIFPPALRAFP